MYYKIINKKKRLATRIGDLIGRMAFPLNLLGRKANRPSFNKVRKILVIRTAYIGDVVLTLPILSPLKKLFPQAQISFLTTCRAKEILEKNPYIDEIVSYDAFWFYPSKMGPALLNYLNILRLIRSRAYDLVIEARGDIRDISLLAYPSRGAHRISYDVGGGGFLLTHIVPFIRVKHKIRYHLDIVKSLGGTASIEWDLYLTEGERHRGEQMLTQKGLPLGKPIVAIHPGARKRLKRWSLAGFSTVADRLVKELGASVIVMGGHEDVEVAHEMERLMKEHAFCFSGSTTLRQMAAILGHCHLLICNDSVPLHIASLLKTPTVAIFGPSKSRETGPYGNTHMVVENRFKCRYHCDEDICNHRPQNECMTSITADNVFNAANEVLQLVLKQKAAYDKPCSIRSSI